MLDVVRIEGVRELTRAIAAIDAGLGKELGQRNKALGARIIAAAFPKPTAVGAGRGATPRPSASRNVLRIMAGGSFRKHHVQEWGIHPVPRDNPRPFLLGAGIAMLPTMEQEYVDGLLEVARKAGIEGRRS